ARSTAPDYIAYIGLAVGHFGATNATEPAAPIQPRLQHAGARGKQTTRQPLGARSDIYASQLRLSASGCVGDAVHRRAGRFSGEELESLLHWTGARAEREQRVG